MSINSLKVEYGHRFYAKYSITSVARTLMARLPWLIELNFESLGKNPTAANLIKYRVTFLFMWKMIYCLYTLESPHPADSNENTQHTFMLKKIK